MFTKQAYAVKHCSAEVVLNSSSGGVFTALSDFFLQRGGVIVGANFNSNTQRLEHSIARTKTDRDAMRGSKYMWSELNNIYNETLPIVNAGQWVLFVGTPCQIAGFKGFLKAREVSLDKVLLCDIVCHGTPEPRLWNDYVEYFNKKNRCNIEWLNFRDKRNGWAHPTTFAYCGNREISIADYTDLFYSQCALQKRCYSCKFANLDRPGNITIGDCWGIDKVLPDFCDDKGISLVIIHDKQGERFFNEIKHDLIWENIPMDSCLQPNLKQPTKPSPERQKFLKEYDKHGIGYVLNKYSKHRLYGKIRHKIKYIMKK